jgi:hypothetical protein
MNTFEDLKNRRDILISLKPIFYDFKETLRIISESKEVLNFQELHNIFYNIHLNNNTRYYPMDPTFEDNLKYPFRIYSLNGRRLLYFMKVAKYFKIVNEIEDLEKEISILDDKINKIRIFNQNRYIINLLSMRT